MTSEWIEQTKGPWYSAWLRRDISPVTVRLYRTSGFAYVVYGGVHIAGPFESLEAAKAAYLMIYEGGK